MPALETERLLVRQFEVADLEACHQLLDIEAWQSGRTIAQRETWLRWTILSYEMLADLRQPPYGDRAVVLRSTGTLVGAVGYVPGLKPFARLPSFGGRENDGRATAEFGMFWSTRSAHQNQGYATEAAGSLIRYAFDVLNLARILAWTDYENTASQAVMRKLGMSIERNPRTEPSWFQVVGVLQNHGR
jgi:RimJ/RimL family protein N-acetyltransferase